MTRAYLPQSLAASSQGQPGSHTTSYATIMCYASLRQSADLLSYHCNIGRTGKVTLTGRANRATQKAGRAERLPKPWPRRMLPSGLCQPYGSSWITAAPGLPQTIFVSPAPCMPTSTSVCAISCCAPHGPISNSVTVTSTSYNSARGGASHQAFATAAQYMMSLLGQPVLWALHGKTQFVHVTICPDLHMGESRLNSGFAL